MAMTNAERKRKSRLRKKLIDANGKLTIDATEEEIGTLASYGNRLGVCSEEIARYLIVAAKKREDLLFPVIKDLCDINIRQVAERDCLLANNNDTTNEDTMLRSLPIDIPVSTEKPKRGRKPDTILCSAARVEPITADSPAYEVAKTLYGIILNKIPNYRGGRPIDVMVWAKSIKDSIIDRDKRDPKDILALLSWISTEKPYLIRRIVKPCHLREQYDSLMDMYCDSKRPRYNPKTGYEIKRTANDKPKKKSVMPDIPHDVRYYELESHWDDPSWVERHHARQAEEEREIQAEIERARQEELMKIPANRYRRNGETELDENGRPYAF